MIIEIKVPSAGESVTQVELARWMVENGSYVEKDQEIAEIDSDKATLTINADGAGKIEITVEEGTSLEPGKIIGKIDTDAKPAVSEEEKKKPEPGNGGHSAVIEKPQEIKEEKQEDKLPKTPSEIVTEFTFSPQAQKLIDEFKIPLDQAEENPANRRITKKDILKAIAAQISHHGQESTSAPKAGSSQIHWDGSRKEEKNKMSALRRKIAERLVEVKNQTAMLTTFNEVDMSGIIHLRKKHQAAFQEKYGIKLGFMSFFIKAVTESIPFFPSINGRIDQESIVLPSYADIGIAVSTPKGLMVPVIRNAESLSLPALEKQIAELAQKARDNKISIDDLSGGTFSITNGGVFGSMLSTPIINPPQSAILGMHNIIQRPMAVNGKVEIRPMMYIALSYDHRIIDGRESVGFLVKVKEFIENPANLILHGKDPGELLLEI